MEQQIFVWFWMAAPLVMWFTMLYGDYLDGEYKPFWQKRKEGVNSGAKFG